MYTVEVRLTPSHLATLMHDIALLPRPARDQRVGIFYTEGINKLITRLIFGAEQEAKAFSTGFAGSMS